jgi:hypothetical protein
VLILLLGSACVATTALVLSARLAQGSVTQWLIGAYVIALCELIVVSLFLSLGSWFSRWPLLASLAGIALVVAALGRRTVFPSVQLRVLSPFFRDGTIVVLAVLVLGVIGYSVALGLFRPPNDQDALEYHLARAAFWRQQHRIDFIPGAEDRRLNSFAPNSEILMAFTMVMAASGRYAPLVQLTAALAAGAAVYGIARRIGIAMRESLMAGLLFVTLPVVALQMSTGLNDVVVAALAGCSCFFVLGRTPGNLVLAGVSVALLTGVKPTSLLALAGLCVVAVVAHGSRFPRVIAVLVTGAIVGEYWYWLHVSPSNDLTGGVSSARPSLDVAAAVSRIVRLLLAGVELPGAIGLERLWYVVAAAVVAAIGLRTAGRLRKRFRVSAIAASFVVLPLALVPIDHFILRGFRKVYYELGRGSVAYLDPNRSPTKASPIFSWYGPASVMLTSLACVLAIRAYRGRRMSRVAVVVAVAPVIWIVLLGASTPYWEWNGRYTMAGWTIGASAWALALSIRPVALGTAALAVVTTALIFVHLHDRASGVRLLEADHESAVWSEPSWSEQATDHPSLRALYRFATLRIPQEATVALQPILFPGRGFAGGNLPPFPFFGKDLSRHIVLAGSPSRSATVGAGWAILRSPPCAPGWRVDLRYGVWRVLEHTPGAACS